MQNKRGLTVSERLHKDLELASNENDYDKRRLLAHMVIAAAELAIDFGLITYNDWDGITRSAFCLT